MARAALSAGSAPAAKGTGVLTFTAMVGAVRERTGLSQNKSRRLTRDYLRGARRPNVAQLLEFVDLVRGRAPIGYADPTGNDAQAKVDRERGAGVHPLV